MQDPITPEAVREELARILASPGFINSRRSSRFLSYIVEATLEGEHKRLKEYAIGIEVFGRPDSFDPRLDSVVRVHATHLRERLRKYYQAYHGPNRVRIIIPSGTYQPRFELLTEDAAFSDDTVPKRSGKVENGDRPLLLVLPCINLGLQQDRIFCNGLTDELIFAVARLEKIPVFAGTYSLHHQDSESAVRRAASCFGVTTVLETTVRGNENKIRVLAHLSDTDRRRITWAQRFESELKDIFITQETMAAAIAKAVAAELDRCTTDAPD